MNKLYSHIIHHKRDYLIIAVFIILSAVIRFTPLIHGDIPFLFDHGRDMLAVKSIVVDHKLTLIGPFTGMQGVFQSPLHFYLLAIPFILTGGNPAGGTWMMVGLALLGIFLCYFLGRKMIDGTFGIILALFFAFSPTSLAFSSHFWNPHWIPFCMILFYYFLYKSIFVDKKFWLWTGLIVGIIAQFEVAFGLPLFISLFFIVILFDIKVLKSIWFWSSIPAFLITFFPQMLFDVRHQFLMTKTILSFLHGASNGTGSIISFPTRLFYRIDEIQRATIFSVSDNRMIGYFLFLPLLIFPVSALFVKKLKKNIKLFLFFVIIPVLFFLFFLCYSHEAWSWYWIGLQTSYYFLLAFVLSRKDRINRIFMYLCITLFIVGTIIPEATKLPLISQGSTGTLKNELRVIDFIYHDAHGKQFGEFVYTPPVYDYAYQYLFWWKSKQYHYLPTKDKNGTFYLIIEPDSEHPYASKGWKETVIKTGKVLWSKKFPGDIIVEKRMGN